MGKALKVSRGGNGLDAMVAETFTVSKSSGGGVPSPFAIIACEEVTVTFTTASWLFIDGISPQTNTKTFVLKRGLPVTVTATGVSGSTTVHLTDVFTLDPTGAITFTENRSGSVMQLSAVVKYYVLPATT